MQTKYLMVASAVFMGLIGIVLVFAPAEVLKSVGQDNNGVLVIAMQLTGALYFGFAMTNWMAKAVLIGGIYARPLSIGNFTHFFIAGLALAKTSFHPNASGSLYVLTICYVVFAVLFGYVAFRHPSTLKMNQC